MQEIWKDVVGYERYYKVSNKGRIKSIKRTCYSFVVPESPKKIIRKGVMLKLGKHRNGYQKISLQKDGKHKYFMVHRVVATAFIPNPENKPQVNHIDYDRSNNCVENLNWMTSKENINHSYDAVAASGRRTIKFCHALPNANKKAVIMMDRCGTYIREYDSMSEATLDIKGLIGASSICQHLRNPDKYPTAYGYKWAYKKTA